MARNGDRSPIQKSLPEETGSEQIVKTVTDKEPSSCSSSTSSSSSSSSSSSAGGASSSSATRRRPWKVSPAASLLSAAGSQKGEIQVTEPSSKSNSNRHLLLLRRHSTLLPHRLRRDFRSFCFCCFCCCSCSCTDIFAQRPSESQMAGTSGDKQRSAAVSSSSAKTPQSKDKVGGESGGSAGPDYSDLEPLPPVEEIRTWGESFDQLMKCAAGRQLFRKFLQCEYSEENILFWLACEDLKRERNPKVIEEKARLIYEDYVSILSPREVSLDSKVREIVNQNMTKPTANTFDEAQLQIYTLMHRDSYPRFLGSSLYRNVAQLSPQSTKSGLKAV